MVAQERRGSQRIEDRGLSLKLEGFDSITHTLNISPSGVYCKIDKPLPLMSRVRLKLMIPDQTREDGQARNLDVGGVVVREHPVMVDGAVKHYDIAIFFEDLSAKDKEAITSYISNKKG
jgi:hypothetical protein